MSDEKMSEMPDIITSTGSLQSTDRLPLIRPGVVNNFSVAVGSLEATGGGPPVYFHDINTSTGTQAFVLPAASADNEQHIVKDISGGHAPGVGAITVTATGGYVIDSGATYPPPPLYWGNFGSYSFRWNASLSKWFVG